MSAPNKIYVNIPGDYWHSGTDKKVNTDTEYIRKDYLLEWAKEMYEAYRKRYEQRNALYYRERMVVFQRLIDKLNEI